MRYFVPIVKKESRGMYEGFKNDENGNIIVVTRGTREKILYNYFPLKVLITIFG